MKRILGFIDENFADEHFSIRKICRTVGISRMHLHRKIKQWTGKSTSHYIRGLRLAKGKDLLQSEPDLFVSEIAYKVGFKDPNYFSRVFRQVYGVSPSIHKTLIQPKFKSL